MITQPAPGVRAACAPIGLQAQGSGITRPPCWASSLQGRIGCGWHLVVVLAPGLHELVATTLGVTANVSVLIALPEPNIGSWSAALAECYATSKLPPTSGGLQWSLRQISRLASAQLNITADVRKRVLDPCER